MSRLRWLTAGESHGPALVATLEGLPAGVPITTEMVADHLARRRLGYGRGARMKFERDEVTFLGGVRHGLTLGSLTRARTALQTGVSRVTLALVHAAGPTLVVSMRAARVHPQCGVKNGSPGANGHLRVAHGRGLTPPLGDFPEIGIFHTAIT